MICHSYVTWNEGTNGVENVFQNISKDVIMFFFLTKKREFYSFANRIPGIPIKYYN